MVVLLVLSVYMYMYIWLYVYDLHGHYIYIYIYIYIYRLNTPSLEYNKARSSRLLPTLSPSPVIDCWSLSTPIISTSVPYGGATRLCMQGCSPHALTVLQNKLYIMYIALCVTRLSE